LSTSNETHLAYSLPHEWGHFSVTHAADVAYEFKPLTPDIEWKGKDETTLPEGDTEILLVGPNEFKTGGMMSPEPAGNTSSVWISEPIITAARGIQIVCGFGKTRQEILTATLQQVARSNNLSMRQLMASHEAETGLPAKEFHAQQISKILLHELLYPRMLASVALGYQNRRRRWLRRVSEPQDLTKAKSVIDDIHANLCIDDFNQKLKQSLDVID
jgi:hypothetical protein